MKKHTKVAYVLCYKDPGYVRSRSLMSMLSDLKNIELIDARNRKKSWLRYPEVLFRVLRLRLFDKPSVYILGFRAYEVYWLVRLITYGKPLIYDEFINPYLWFVEEHKKFSPSSPFAKLLRRYTAYMLNSSNAVLTDTNLNKIYSSEKFHINEDKIHTIYVGTDEDVFKPVKAMKRDDEFVVFFYGNFLPLHGIGQIVTAAKKLKRYKDIKFIIIGGGKKNPIKKKFLKDIQILSLDNVEHKPWVDFNEIPKYIAASDVCLGGPFAGTPQAKKVITGKTYQFLASGKATIVGRVAENIGFEDKVNCILVDQGSDARLAEEILWAHKNRKDLKKIGNTGRMHYQNHFSVGAQMDRLDTVITQVAG